ncbi:Uncharacterised protein [uncultured archaeon]|nr:Uncharacterised protein [uncultured archaeon]
MLDLIADVTNCQTNGTIIIKPPLREALGIKPKQHFYLYVDSPYLYLFLYRINYYQYYITFEFENVESFIKLSMDLADQGINIISSNYRSFPNNYASLIYEIPKEKHDSLYREKFINFIENKLKNKDKYPGIELKDKFWYGDASDSRAQIYRKLIENADDEIPKIRLLKNNSITIGSDIIKPLFDETAGGIKRCVQIAYPKFDYILLQFIDRIKKVYLEYPNQPGSYARTLRTLKNLKIETIISIQQNKEMARGERSTGDMFILKIAPEHEKDFESGEKLLKILNVEYFNFFRDNSDFIKKVDIKLD